MQLGCNRCGGFPESKYTGRVASANFARLVLSSTPLADIGSSHRDCFDAVVADRIPKCAPNLLCNKDGIVASRDHMQSRDGWKCDLGYISSLDFPIAACLPVTHYKPNPGYVLNPATTAGVKTQTAVNPHPAKTIEFIMHNRKRVLFVDCSHCSAREMEDIVRKIPDYVTARPRHSVLIFADFTQTCFDHESIRTMKETAVFNKSYVGKSAWIGTASFLWDIKRELERFSHRSFSVFDSKDDALRWLTAD